MKTVRATDLKNRLGEVLTHARLAPVAIERHGRIVAYMVPAPSDLVAETQPHTPKPVDRKAEEKLVRLCVGGDYRPSRWRRAGDRRTMAGIAVMLASQPDFDRPRFLALAEALYPGMSTVEVFGPWLKSSPVRASRFMPLVVAALAGRTKLNEAGSSSSPRS